MLSYHMFILNSVLKKKKKKKKTVKRIIKKKKKKKNVNRIQNTWGKIDFLNLLSKLYTY